MISNQHKDQLKADVFAAQPIIKASRKHMHDIIQECEICGLLDHHCIEGVCPRCKEKITSMHKDVP